LEDFMKMADQNGDGRLDYNEFVKAMTNFWYACWKLNQSDWTSDLGGGQKNCQTQLKLCLFLYRRKRQISIIKKTQKGSSARGLFTLAMLNKKVFIFSWFFCFKVNNQLIILKYILYLIITYQIFMNIQELFSLSLSKMNKGAILTLKLYIFGET
jgi:hypothetical protein